MLLSDNNSKAMELYVVEEIEVISKTSDKTNTYSYIYRISEDEPAKVFSIDNWK